MTSVATALDASRPVAAPRARSLVRSISVADVAVVAALAWWATRLTWGSGGRDPHVLSIEAALVAVACVMTRSWRRLGRMPLALACAAAVAPWIVVATAPTGWHGANDAASYSVAAALFLAVAAWARDDARRIVVIGAVLVACAAEFERAFLPWWGYGSRSPEMWGTFYWHNEFAAFLLPGLVLGLGASACGVRSLAALAWLAAPLSLAGIFFSTSRGGQAAAFLGLVGAGAIAWRAGRWSGLRRMGAVLTLGAAVIGLLSSPLLFPHHASLSGGNAERAATFAGDSASRLGYWHHAVQVWLHWPVSGAGFHSFASATAVAVGHSAANTAFAHDTWLQAFVDGGLVLGIPILLATGALAWLAGRTLVRAVRRRADLLHASAATALLVLLAHSAIDFDFTYAALLATAAIVAGIVVAPDGDALRLEPRRAARTVAVVLVVAALGLAAVGAWAGNWHFNFPVGSR